MRHKFLHSFLGWHGGVWIAPRTRSRIGDRCIFILVLSCLGFHGRVWIASGEFLLFGPYCLWSDYLPFLGDRYKTAHADISLFMSRLIVVLLCLPVPVNTLESYRWDSTSRHDCHSDFSNTLNATTSVGTSKYDRGVAEEDVRRMFIFSSIESWLIFFCNADFQTKDHYVRQIWESLFVMRN